MLIANAEIYGSGVADLRIENGVVAAIGQLSPRPGEPVLEMDGAAVLPGLNDHHIHLLAYAASLDSVRCGPPEVNNARQLIETVAKAQPNESGWIRGIGYHESVAGDIDRHWLDRCARGVPIRIQHRSGRLWILNSAGLARVAQDASPSTDAPRKEQPDQDGRFYDQDRHLARRWGLSPPAIARASRELAKYGITGITDLTPSNDTSAACHIEHLRASGQLLQEVRVGGTLAMTHVLTGPTKVHLHETSLPDFEDLCTLIGNSHANAREVAVHCVTEAELVFALAALRTAGVQNGDRIEHASVTPPPLLAQIRELGLAVVTQPHFIAERGDAYWHDLPAQEHPRLYRCRSFLDNRIPLAAGSDAPFGHPDPWRAMRAAVERRTATGRFLGEAEALTPEQALSLFLGSLSEPAKPRRIEVGAPADLCLLDYSWRSARGRLDCADVRATVHAGRIIFAKFPDDGVKFQSHQSAPKPRPVRH